MITIVILSVKSSLLSVNFDFPIQLLSSLVHRSYGILYSLRVELSDVKYKEQTSNDSDNETKITTITIRQVTS